MSPRSNSSARRSSRKSTYRPGSPNESLTSGARTGSAWSGSPGPPLHAPAAVPASARPSERGRADCASGAWQAPMRAIAAAFPAPRSRGICQNETFAKQRGQPRRLRLARTRKRKRRSHGRSGTWRASVAGRRAAGAADGALRDDAAHPRVRGCGGRSEPRRRGGLRPAGGGEARCRARAAAPVDGQEAVAAGVCANLRRADYLTSTHRGHGHTIAKGADLGRMMQELHGREGGSCGGRGGSMHIADFGVGMLGANGVVAAGLPIAVGAAHSVLDPRRDRDRRVLLRRRRDQPRPVRGIAELGAGLPPAGALRLRGQPLVGHDADRVADRGRWRRRAGARARHRGADRGRQRRRGRRCRGRRPRRRGASGRRAAFPARDHVPGQGARLGRSGRVPRPGRARGRAHDRPAAARPHGAREPRGGRGRARRTRGRRARRRSPQPSRWPRSARPGGGVPAIQAYGAGRWRQDCGGGRWRMA